MVLFLSFFLFVHLWEEWLSFSLSILTSPIRGASIHSTQFMENLDVSRLVPGTREINMNEQMTSALQEFTVIEAEVYTYYCNVV